MPTEDSKGTEKTAIAVSKEEKEGDGKAQSNNKGDKHKPEELSEEDQALKEGLELAVSRLQESDADLHKQALDHLANEIKSSTSSMTSVPKPLKFLRPHYDSLKLVYEAWPNTHSMKEMMADVMSVLAMTMAPQGSRESLKFKMKGTQVNVSSWGHEYVRSLAGEISEEYNQRAIDIPAEDEIDVDDLMVLVDDIVPFQMKHNAEAEAVDLLMEISQLNKLTNANPPVVDDRNYERVCLYLLRSASFIADPDDLETLYLTAYQIYKGQKKYTDALRVAIKMDRAEFMAELFADSEVATEAVQKQMAFILARHRSNFQLPDDVSNAEEINELIGNGSLSERYLGVARDMDLVAPKAPEDIYKSHLSSASAARRGLAGGLVAAAVDSARANLASTFVNAFVNAGHCKDKLIISEAAADGTSGDNGWLYKNKGHGMLSAAASLGMLMMWNVEEGLNQIDKYFHNSEELVKAGACLGVGLISIGVRNDAEPALALLSDYIEHTSHDVRVASTCGLGLAYAGARKEEVQQLLEGTVASSSLSIVEVSLAALSLGLSFVGTCNDDVGLSILQRLMEATEEELNHTASRFMCLGLGLVYLGKMEQADAALEAVRTIEHARGKYAEVTLETCAYAGTGNVLKVQHMLRLCTDHIVEASVLSEHQAVAVMGISLINIGEEIGTEMTLRTFEHLLHYGELPIRRMVPLALSLLYVSNPDYGIIDQLSRLSHDQDAEIAQGAILGLGLVSAGSNNSRVSGLLRQLSDFYAKEANFLFLVRIAQGLNGLGKGLLGLSPFHSDRFLMDGPGLAGLLVVLHASIDMKGTVLDKMHYLLFFLSLSMNPRYLAIVDSESLEPLTISVRVGQAVETVGQAGRPKTITGFQTHTTPVLLGFKDRAEMAGGFVMGSGITTASTSGTDGNKVEYTYTPLSSVLEGVVLTAKAAMVTSSTVPPATLTTSSASIATSSSPMSVDK